MGRVADLTRSAPVAPAAFQRESAIYIAKDVYRQHGLRGLWTGQSGPHGMMPFSLFEFSSDCLVHACILSDYRLCL